MANSNYKHLWKIHPNLDLDGFESLPPSEAELNSMQAALQQLQKLQEDNLADFNTQLSLLTNFQRAYYQATFLTRLNRHLIKQESGYYHNIENFHSCIEEHAGKDGKVTKRQFFGCYGEFAFKEYYYFGKWRELFQLGELKVLEKKPADIDLHEPVGPIERQVMHEAYKMMDDKSFENPIVKLNLHSGRSVKANLNRVQQQISEIHGKINVNVKRLSDITNKFYTCLKRYDDERDDVDVQDIKKKCFEPQFEEKDKFSKITGFE